MTSYEPKHCPICGRTFEYQKRWRTTWAQVRYCSDRCRRTRLTDTDRRLEEAILVLLAARGRGQTICPSEAARAVGGEAWQALMDRTRRAGRRLAARGEVEFLQQGRVINPSRAKGAVQIRRAARKTT